MTPTIFLVVAAAVLAVFSVRYFWKSWQELPSEPLTGPLGKPDVIAGSVLSIWFLWVVAESSSGPQVVTPSAVLGSGIIYSGILGLIILLLTLRGIPLGQVFGLAWPATGGWLPVVALSFLAVLPLVVLAQWCGSLFFAEDLQAQPLLDYWLRETEFSNRALVVVMALVVAPIAEEFIFRGYLYQVARRTVGCRWAMIAVSLLFAAIHAHLPAFAGLFVLAMALNLLYARLNSIWAPILMHAGFNAVTLIATLLWPDLA